MTLVVADFALGVLGITLPISKPALPWTALASDPGIPATPNKVPNWLSLSSLLQVSPAQPSLGKCLLVVTF